MGLIPQGQGQVGLHSEKRICHPQSAIRQTKSGHLVPSIMLSANDNIRMLIKIITQEGPYLSSTRPQHRHYIS